MSVQFSPDKVDVELLNSEEYRKIVYNTLIPEIKKQSECKKTSLNVAGAFSKNMIIFLEKKVSML